MLERTWPSFKHSTKALIRPKVQQKDKANVIVSSQKYKFVPFAPIDRSESLVGVLEKYRQAE